MVAIPEGARTWTIPLVGYMRPPLTLNSRMHWRVKANLTADLRNTGVTYTRKLKIPPLDRFTAVLHYAPRDARERDTENIAPSSKPVVDGMCWVHKQPDSRDHYLPSMPVIHDPTGEPGRLWLEVIDLSSAPNHASTETEAI